MGVANPFHPHPRKQPPSNTATTSTSGGAPGAADERVRQESWFRRDPRIVWLAAGEPDLAGRALATIRSCGLPRATEPGMTS